jgi:hypothetical protein
LLRKFSAAFWTLKTVMLPLPALTAKRREWSWLRVSEPLRFERVGNASAATTVGLEGNAFAEGAVGGALEGDDFVFARVVGHDEDSADGVVGLCRGKSWECGANSDGEHQETSSYLQHLQLLVKDRSRETEEGR